ncbi:MAG: succinylglutamate desuccinylase/aspartoacylase family protein [Salegentibacter sp.]|uniref:Succinylglutamate desuccinylase n=1 Tax=Salegentibacter flavus TaxID=287099 RepID=A0A1I5CGW6_9FLAO|nr:MULTISPECIES: succinylglutamate desuccinylase/aspartoacylase family protein [Salegentibacter]MDR9457153.1 succinylglutamate desuccinylase/aspartoacylase family protein [Salegentibacter sp.]SFN86166.1 succinylglutamate desuccinylase [Salegentibacter flavus]
MDKQKKEIPRIIGKYTSGKKGPLLFVTGGVHGNEPSGVQALEKVFSELEKSKPEIEGTIIGVSGNKKALNQNKRFLDEDLNRTWTEENIQQRKKETHEQREMWEIIEVLEQHPESDFTKRYFLDCHTTSSPSLPYISVQEVNENDEWAHRFPTYIVRGFSDIVYGCIDHYLSRTGLTGFVLEAGQHTDKTSVENHEGVIWLALKEACNLDLTKISCYPNCIDNFAEKNAPEQKTFELVHRHGLEDSDEFKTEPGFENFQKIKKGELLAIQNGKEIKSEWDARIFMPLYQAQGNDGFFVIEEVEEVD